MNTSHHYSRAALRINPYPRYPVPYEHALRWRNHRNGPGKGMSFLRIAVLGSLTYFIAKKILQ